MPVGIKRKLTETLGGRALEQVVNGSAYNYPLAAGVDGEPTNLNAMTTSNALDERCLANNVHKLLTSITVLEDIADVARGHLLLQRDADRVLERSQHCSKIKKGKVKTYVNTLEPGGNMGNERNASVKLRADLPLVNVISQAVSDEVVGQEVDVVLRARLGTSAGVPRNTERGGLATEIRNQGTNSNLGGGSVASRVGYPGSLSNLGPVDQLRETIGPLAVETVVRTQIDDHVTLLGALVDSIDEGLANAVGEGHDPAVNVAVLRHALHIIRAQVLIGDITLVVALQLLACELPRRHMAKVQVRVGVDQADQGLTGVATGTNKSNLGRLVVRDVLLPERGVRVRGGVVPDALHCWAGKRPGSPQGIGGRGESTGLLKRCCASTNTLAQLRGRLSSTDESGLEVDITKHVAAMLVEFLHQLLDLVAILDTVPEEHVSVAAQATFGLVEEPGEVLIVFLDGPHHLGEVFPDGGEHVVGHIAQPPRLCDGEGSEVSQS